MTRPLTPKGGNDRVYTPPELARAIVKHFAPVGYSALEPCAGKGAFTAALGEAGIKLVFACEIDEGSDFMTWQAPVDWIITNPPWSKLLPFLEKSMQVASDVVFLCLVPAFFHRSKQEAMRRAGFGMREILFVPTPPKPWPQTGFCLGAVHIQRGYIGSVSHNLLGDI